MPLPNIQLNYLYRDAGNYKIYHLLVFSNKHSLDLELIEATIRKHLIEGEYFIPEKWNVPIIQTYAYDTDLDHDWYEFEGVEYTEEASLEEKDIKEFLSNLISIQSS